MAGVVLKFMYVNQMLMQLPEGWGFSVLTGERGNVMVTRFWELYFLNHVANCRRITPRYSLYSVSHKNMVKNKIFEEELAGICFFCTSPGDWFCAVNRHLYIIKDNKLNKNKERDFEQKKRHTVSCY